MQFLKRLGLYGAILLLIMSIYQDLSKEDQPGSELDEETIVKVKATPGDTVLSITESLNPEMGSWDIDQVIDDFQALNPEADPHHLQTDRFYYFMYYHTT